MTELTPESMLPLTPAVLHILLALSEGEKHGYAIMQEVTRQTERRVRMGPGTLYGSINRMISSGLVAESEERAEAEREDVRRRYYRICEFGQRVLAAELNRLRDVVRLPAARLILGVEGE